MDMKIDCQKIIMLRKQHSWSQQHLADVSSLSLRTIQRIESEGKASYESIRAIASAFEIESTQLLLQQETKPTRPKSPLIRFWKPFTSSILATLLGIFYLSSASAKPILMDITVATDNQPLSQLQLFNEVGKSGAVEIERKLKLTVTSEITAESEIKIQTQIYLFDDQSGFQLTSAPILITQDNKSAVIELNGEDGRLYQLTLTPHIID